MLTPRPPPAPQRPRDALRSQRRERLGAAACLNDKLRPLHARARPHALGGDTQCLTSNEQSSRASSSARCRPRTMRAAGQTPCVTRRSPTHAVRCATLTRSVIAREAASLLVLSPSLSFSRLLSPCRVSFLRVCRHFVIFLHTLCSTSLF
mgnify:CR=1 FL=1